VGNEKTLFDPVSLDLANECLRRGSQAIRLRPKAFAVLTHLLGHSGKLVTKQELLDVVWPETFVSEAVLKVTIRQLRQALDDDPKCPRFIETSHRRGYRFIGEVGDGGQMLAKDQSTGNEGPSAPAPFYGHQPCNVVGRDEALALMRSWRDKMLAGERQIVFVTGEAGIGKSALVDTFARSIGSNRGIRIGRGQCLEQYGTGEAYLPVLEAIGRLCREHEEVVDVLRAHAPMWLLQMPSLVRTSERELLNREVVGATRERMLREMGDTLEALTADMPLVLILEDLHWSDYSTLDLISYLGRQRHSNRLMVIGTYRTVELTLSGHPLKAVKRDLLAKQQCEELWLEYLSEAAVAEYLSVRFPRNQFPARLAGLIHKRTEGNPLFMVNVVDYLESEGLIVEYEDCWELLEEIEKVELGVPDSIKQMIEKQVDHLDDEERRILEGASVAGVEFSALALASGLAEEPAEVEALCDELTRQGLFLEERGVTELPNGEVVSRYGFIHALYQNVLYERVSVSRRVQVHRRIADRGEDVYGDRAREIAAEFAMHYERGANYKQAVKYLRLAADNAMRRFAYREAVGLARRGLELIEKLPDTRERAQSELCLQLTLGVPLIATEGYAAPDVGSAYWRARELCQQLGDTPDVSEVLWGLWTFHTLRADLGTARKIAQEFLCLSERLPYPGLAMRGHWAMEITYTHLGEFELAMEHLEKALSLYLPERHLDDAFLYALNPGVAMPCFAAWSLWFLGQPDKALQRINDALNLARQLGEPHGIAHALFFASVLYQLRREEQLAREHAAAAIAVSREHGLTMYQAMASIMYSWTLINQESQEEAITQMRCGLAALHATSTELVRPHFLALLVEALDRAQQVEEALQLVDEAITVAQRTGECSYQAELYRLKGEILLKQSTGRRITRATTSGKTVLVAEAPAMSYAERCFREAIKIAQRQNAKSLELRAAMSVARLYRDEGREKEAHELVATIYDQFTEGFDTADLREAKVLLEELAESCDANDSRVVGLN
jgi:DNA-binding winged helix-turn-helix (wHTH) protein/predicted ATPase